MSEGRAQTANRRAPWVLLHGFTGTGASWRRVRAAIEEIERDARVDDGKSGSSVEADARRPIWTPDLPGHGARADARPPSFEAVVDELAAEIEARFSRPVHLAGYSLGGRLALGLLVRHRHLFARATLISSRAGLADEAAREDRAARDDDLADDLLRHGLEAFVDRWQALPLFATQTRLPLAIRDQMRQLRLAQDAAGLAHALRVLSPGRMPDYQPSLPAVDLPVRLVAGELDRKYCELLAEMAAALPRARLSVLAGCGHNPLAEAPEALARVLLGDGGSSA